MKPSTRAVLLVFGSVCCFAFPACGDDDDDGPGGVAGSAQGGSDAQPGGASGGPGGSGGSGGSGEGGTAPSTTLECEVLGELCHAADSGVGAAHECHELGHVADGEACHTAFAGCVTVCTADEGAGGAGGAGTGGAPADVEAPHCVALGELCHPVDDVDGPLHECHELGHVQDAALCEAEFNSCATQCLAALEALEGGVGGAGGAAGAGAGGQGVSAGTEGI